MGYISTVRALTGVLKGEGDPILLQHGRHRGVVVQLAGDADHPPVVLHDIFHQTMQTRLLDTVQHRIVRTG